MTSLRATAVALAIAASSYGCSHSGMHAMHSSHMAHGSTQGMGCCSMCGGGMSGMRSGSDAPAPMGGMGNMKHGSDGSSMSGMVHGNASKLPGAESQAMSCSAAGGCGAQGGMCGCCGMMAKPKA
jgi:hypothetical protein